MSYLRRRQEKRTARLNAKAGKRVWTRILVHREYHPDGSMTKRVFLGMYPKPAFRCIFVSEDGDKHLNVIGPDGKEYTVHKCYAGKNPAVTVSFDGFYTPALPWYPDTHKSIAPAAMRHVPGSSTPDKTTEFTDMQITYPKHPKGDS